MRFRYALIAIFSLLLFSGSALAQGAKAVNPNARDLLKLGNEQYSKAQYDAAIAEYARVTPEDGELYSQALYNIGVCYFELWRTDDAIAMYRKALAGARGRYPRASYSLGVALHELKRYPEAIDAYRQAIAASGGKHAESYFKLGVLSLEKDRDNAAALALFKQAVAHSENPFPSGHNNLGVVLARLGRLAEAEQEFKTAVSQSEGTLMEAQQNLQLCRSLLAQANRGGVLQQVGELNITK